MYIHWSEMVYRKSNGLVIFDNNIKSLLAIVSICHVTINVWVFKTGQLVERIQNTRSQKSKLARSFEAWSATPINTTVVIKSNVVHCCNIHWWLYMWVCLCSFFYCIVACDNEWSHISTTDTHRNQWILLLLPWTRPDWLKLLSSVTRENIFEQFHSFFQLSLQS